MFTNWQQRSKSACAAAHGFKALGDLMRSYEIYAIAPGHPASVRQSSTECAACADCNKRGAYSSFRGFVMMGNNLVRPDFVNMANAVPSERKKR